MAWNESAFVPEDHEAAKYRGTAYLRRNGFSAVR